MSRNIQRTPGKIAGQDASDLAAARATSCVTSYGPPWQGRWQICPRQRRRSPLALQGHRAESGGAGRPGAVRQAVQAVLVTART
jgi:hypothetical protein